MWWHTVVGVVGGVVGGVVLVWVLLLVVLWRFAPEKLVLGEALRLLPDVLRLLRRLAGDDQLPRGVRVRVWLLLAYLAMPIDLVPDFVPVLGYADDAVIVVVVLRSVTRRAGVGALERHWPGTPAGLAAVTQVAGLRAT